MKGASNKFEFRVAAASIACSISFSVFLFTPLVLFLGNLREFSVPFWSVAFSAIIVSAAAGMVIFVMTELVPKAWRGVVSAALFSIAISVYIQGNAMIWDYGLLTGGVPHWSNVGYGVWVEVVVWAGLFVVCIWARRRLVRWIPVSCIGMLIIQLVSLLVGIVERESPPSQQRYSVDESPLAQYSPDGNVFLIVLDQFQSTTFDELLTESSDRLDSFVGFTYFRNATAGYAKTYGSVPNLLSGQYFDNREPYAKYLQRVYSKSLLAKLREANFEVEIFPWVDKTIEFDPKIISNIIPRFETGWFSDEILQLFDLALFRHSPHVLKQQLTDGETFFIGRMKSDASAGAADSNRQSAVKVLRKGTGTRDLRFAKATERAVISGEKGKTFKFIHLKGPHEPFNLDEEFHVRRIPLTHDGYKSEARTSLRVVEAFLSRLTELGLYDSSTIFIVSDHGAGEYGIPIPGVEFEPSGVDPKIIQSGLPLVLVKPPDAEGSIQTSNVPVSLMDIPATVCDLIGLNWDGPGESMFRVKEDVRRVRRFLYYTFKGWDQEYLPSMAEFEIDGHSWSMDSWRSTGRVFDPRELDGVLPVKPLHVGMERRFGRNGDGRELLTFGWSVPEDGYVWSDGWAAKLTVPVNFAGKGSWFIFALAPIVGPGVPTAQTVNLAVNGFHCGSWRVDGPGYYAIMVPKSNMAAGQIEIDMTFPDAVSPDLDLGIKNDSRLLSVQLSGIRIVEITDRSPINFTFGVSGSVGRYLREGWHGPEAGWTWSKGDRSEIEIPVWPGMRASEIVVDVQPLLVSGELEEQVVRVYANGYDLGIVAVSERSKLKFSLPPEVHEANNILLEFIVPNARIPIAQGVGTPDLRVLGLCFYSIEVLPGAFFGDEN